MTILIKGVEMPKNCYKCFCYEQIKAGVDHPAFDYCVLENWRKSCTPLTMTAAEAMEGIADWCPLIEVPTPHGRLIDADDFDSRIRAAGGLADEELTDDFKDGVLSVLTLMKTQNTVIEAEEG